jgi:D-psicose/D-tagatose/L-ribulose 3-epimerase
MEVQNYQIEDRNIREKFLLLKEKQPEGLKRRLNLSWSNWGFGLEDLKKSVRRLAKNQLEWIELHGNHYGPDLGYKTQETMKILADHGLKVAGVCGMFSRDNDLSSSRPAQRQNAIDYIKRELDFGKAVGATYMLVVPGAVGRPDPYDGTEFQRSVATLRSVSGLFVQSGMRAAVEPIRVEEVSFCHTVRDAKAYIAAVGHPGVRHINGDVFHMQTSEAHIGSAILEAGPLLVNLHMADSNRLALGKGHLDLDTIIMALYLIGYNRDGCFVTPEPLGAGGDPYRAMNGVPDPTVLDALVSDTIGYFREREKKLLL